MSAAPPSPAADQSMVETMTGPIETADLGFVLMHEHIIVRSEGLAQNFPHIWDPQPALDRALELLTALKAKGVDTPSISPFTAWEGISLCCCLSLKSRGCR